jgi:LacI family transcriptional regulator
MAVTMKQIADELGLSIVTVSKAIRNHDDISRKTRALVMQKVEKLKYRPNLTARSLVTGRSFLVGLLVPDLLHPFFAEVARSLGNTLRKEGLYLLICSSEGDPELERQQLEHLLSRHLDAIVVAPVGADLDALAMVAESGTPLILLDRKAPVENAHFVGVNDLMVGKLATLHLISIGCKRIAHLRGPQNSVGERRLEGYKQALASSGMKFFPELVSETSPGDINSTAQGAERTKKLLSAPRRPDGLFCFNDPLAIGAIDTALAAGITIPKQLAIVGCGNLHYDQSLRIPLSSIDQKSAKIGEHAARIIIDHYAALRMAEENDLVPSGGVTRIVLRPRLVVRGSTQR